MTDKDHIFHQVADLIACVDFDDTDPGEVSAYLSALTMAVLEGSLAWRGLPECYLEDLSREVVWLMGTRLDDYEELERTKN